MSVSPGSNGAPLPRARLLVVEDDLPAVFVLRHFFALAGYDVDCAAGPNEGLRLLDRNSYDAVITDFHVAPDRHADGIRVATHARHRNPAACIVMLTGEWTAFGEADARRCGVDIYDAAPVDLARLMAGVARVLAERRAPRVPDPGTARPAVGSGEGC